MVSPEETTRSAAEIAGKFHKLAFGVRTLKLYSAHGHEPVIEATDAALAGASGELRYAPRRPLLLPQLLRAVNDTEASRREIASIIGRDPALAANLLKLANSAFYRVKEQPVESIDRAVAVLGTDGIRSLISAALLQPVFRMSGDAFREFPEVTWDHTFMVASAAEAFAAGSTEADPFAAQLLGMLMGLGAIIVFRATLDQYARHQDLQPQAAIIASLIDRHCAGVAKRVAAGWQLSDRMLEALGEQQPDRPLEQLSPLGQCLRLGRLAGALAVLHKHELVTDDEVQTALLFSGAPAARCGRIWARLDAGREEQMRS